jgi:hypothetical protein
MRWLLILAVLAPLGACTQAPLDAETIAQTLCDCITPTGTTACVDDLEPEIDAANAACTQCIEAHETSCKDLVAECQTTCISQEVPDGSP